MPIYMDRHNLDENIDAEHVARIHQEDLKFEHEFGCKGLTYWYDGPRKTAFCLIKAPNKEALMAMHDKAHGGIPNSIIEVNTDIVESFLGRIVDPNLEEDQVIPIIDDPAFRIIMMIETRRRSLCKNGSLDQNEIYTDFHGFIVDQISHYNGRLVMDSSYSYLVSFKSISDAMSCASIVYSEYEISSKVSDKYALHIGLSSGLPVSEGKEIFEESIREAKTMCREVEGGVVLSSSVFELCKSPRLFEMTKQTYFRPLKPSDERLLVDLIDFTEKSWNKTDLRIEDFSSALGLSKSQLYRKVKFLTGKSLNIFLKIYRLNNALKMIDNYKGNISEIAFDSGFNSAAYFSKCFAETYGILPSDYARRSTISR